MVKKSRIAIALAAAVAFCLAMVAFNFNNTFASEELQLRILKNVRIVKGDVKSIKRILKRKCKGVPETGQTVSVAPGDDGDLRMGIPWPDPRFTANVDNNKDGDCTDPGETCDGTVTDNLTGLIWLKDANCFGQRNWADALSDCNNLAEGQCGLIDNSVPGDWRLPNVRELFSLVDYGSLPPGLSAGHPFENADEQLDYRWTSTTHSADSNGASVVWFNAGYVYFKGKHIPYYVWPVRGGN